MVRKQVQSNASEGMPAKLRLRTKGPYRVIEKASEDSYLLQKIPGTSTMLKTKGSKPIKEAAFRIHKVPSTIVLHKRVDTPDTRLASMRQMLSHSPLEQQLGLVDFGRYATTPKDIQNAFVPIKEIWNEGAEPSADSSDEDEEPNDTPAPEEIDAMQRITPHPINQRETRTQPHTSNQREQTKDTPRQVLTKETLPMPLMLQAMYERTIQSSDKLYIIAHKDDDSGWKAWYVAHVDMEETNEKLEKPKGQYHCKWYIPKVERRTIIERPFWPLIKEFKDESTYSKTVYVRPTKVKQFLDRNPHKHAWYQKEVNLAEDGVTGPFNFNNDFTIPQTVWKEVQQAAPSMKLNVNNIHIKNTPRTSKRKRKRTNK